MKYGLYVIRDEVAEDSGFPFDAKTDGVALRKFSGFIQQIKEQNGANFSAEFSLWKVGQYDSETMQLVALNPDKIHVLEVDDE